MPVTFTSQDRMPCQRCGAPTLVALLDAKPGPGDWSAAALVAAADAGLDFDRLECRSCYGPNFTFQNEVY